ncbi:acetyl-CoA C-acyltransferase [Litorivivens sp.]|uniref:acetyl-CoA C-acyltransferase n=1 Tax=Litorivivens sp. TaxID=2020868 RepID=UPI00356A4E90
MADAYIYDAVRTPRGKGQAATGDKPGGSLSSIAPHTLVSQLIDALAERNGDEAIGSVERLLLGCVGQVRSQGGHIALVSRLASQLPDTVVAKTLNNYCVSGLSAVGESSLWAQAGQPGLSLAGGVESLSQVPFMADKAAYYLNDELRRELRWALPVMGAELIASLEGYNKAELDALSLNSHQRASAAWEKGYYDSSVIPVHHADGSVALAQDEWVRNDLTQEKLGKLPPAFAEIGAAEADAMMLAAYPQLKSINHLHSVANCPGLSDGAALVLTGSKEAGAACGLKPRARIRAYAECAGDPVIQFSAGFDAMQRVLDQSGVSLAELDLIEFMEAFAATPLKFLRNYEVDSDKVNVNGGLIAIGHALGATGASLVATLFHELERRDAQLGMVVCLAAGGIGSAMIVERT